VISLMDALKQSRRGNASSKGAAPSAARRPAPRRVAKKAHRAAARARKAG
jgi:DNA end-binding protein Ku